MSNKNYETIIFDLDGTLFYTSDDIANSMNKTLKEFGFEEMENDRIIGHVGGGISSTVNKVFGDSKYGDASFDFEDDLIQKIVDRYKEIYAENYLDTTRPYQNVEDTLDKLDDKGIKMAVISNKAINYTEKIVKHHGLDKYFQIILGGDSLDKKKPNPEPLNHVIKETRSSPESTLFVGDTGNDIKAAKNAGVDSCAVSYGMRSKEHLEEMEPDYMVDGFDGILNIIN